jgi:hypothetical protein
MTNHQDFNPSVSISYVEDMQPEEIDAKALALDILRVCFNIEVAEGTRFDASQVRDIRNEMGVEKFILVPDERAGELLDRSLSLLAELAGHYPEAGGGASAPVVEAPAPEVSKEGVNPQLEEAA